jgi:putative acetyltransferase
VTDGVEIREVSWLDPRGVALRDAQQAEIAERYGVDDSEPGPKPTASDVTLFLVAFDGDEAVACGALRRLDDEHGEIKRMYVRPDRRGTGLSTLVLRRLEDAARRLGWTRVVLETGTEQPDAMRFYEREGYAPIPPFGYYVGSELSRCYELVL